MKRRGFLKTIVGSFAGFSFILGASVRPKTPTKKKREPAALAKSPEQKFYEAFKAELKKYPRGHVARSIHKIEIAFNLHEEGYLIRGFSVGANPNDGKYFAMQVTFDGTKLNSKNFLKKFTRDALEQVRLAWKYDHRMWGVA